MCMFKSGIALKDRCYVPDHDCHTQMLEELQIEDTTKNAELLFVRFELVPPNNDPYSNIDEWKLNVDQDIVPDWFVKDAEIDRIREAVKKWATARIFVGVDDLILSEGTSYYLKNCKDVMLKGTVFVSELDSSWVGTMWDSSQVGTMWDSSQVGTMRDSSQVGTMWNSSQVGTMRDSSQVGTMRDSSQVGTMRNSTTAIISSINSSNIIVENIILCNNATIKDNRTKTIYQSGDWKLVTVKE